MNCDVTFNAGIHYVTDAYKRVCEFNEELHADLEKYRAENAKLRERGAQLFDKTLELGTENAKLRELVRDMYGFIQSMDEDCGDVIFSDCFDYCKHEAADDGCRKIGKCWYDRRMHELGVEVDG